MGKRVVKTVCSRDCFSGCTIDVHVEDGRIVKVEGGEGNKGTFGTVCAKGMRFIDYVYSPDRLKYPMVRDGARGEGKFRRVSWDFAAELMCEKLGEVKEKYGPLGLMYYTSGGCRGMMDNYGKSFFKQFGGYTIKKGNLCCSAGVEAVKLTYGELKQNAPWDLENAGLIILWGKNPAHTNVHEMRYINNALAKGAKLVTIDPIRNTSSARSHLHISPNPGTDMALALCIINLLIQRGSIDRDFIERYTFGFDALREHAAKYSPLEVSRLCGINEKEIFSVVELTENSKPMTLICGFGLQRYKNGGQTVRAISMIPALTGDIGQRGGGFRFQNGQWKGRLQWPYSPRNEFKIRDDYPASCLAEAIEDYKDPGLSMLWVERANPLVMHPDINRLKKVMDNLECIVVVEQFMTDTAKHADILLPAQSFFEFSDIFAGDWTPYILMYQKAIEPYFESKNESQIYRMLGRKLGYDMEYLPEYDDNAINEILKYSGIGIDLETLKKGPYMEENMEIAYADGLFKTPSGRIELYSETMNLKWGESPIPDYTCSSTVLEKKYPLRFLSTHAQERIHSQFADIKGLERNKAFLYINSIDAAERGISDGDRVEIFNDSGKIFAYAKITESIKAGVVNVFSGLSERTGTSVNILTGQGTSDIGWGAAYYDCFVEVRKV